MKCKLMIMLILSYTLLCSCTQNNTSPTKSIQPTVAGQTQSNLGLVTPNPEETPVIIASVLHDEYGLETIVIKNISDQKQDIHGYSVLIASTTEHINILNESLEPGASFKIYNGPGAKEQTDGLAWLDHPVLQQWGDDLTLLNQAGRVIWTYVYYP